MNKRYCLNLSKVLLTKEKQEKAKREHKRATRKQKRATREHKEAKREHIDKIDVSEGAKRQHLSQRVITCWPVFGDTIYVYIY